MTDALAISDHWGQGDIYALIHEKMALAWLDPETMTVEQLAPVDHFHARGFLVELVFRKQSLVQARRIHSTSRTAVIHCLRLERLLPVEKIQVPHSISRCLQSPLNVPCSAKAFP